MPFWKRKESKTISSESVIKEALSRARKISNYTLRLFSLRDISQALSKAGEIERALDVIREIGKLRFALNPESVDKDRASALSNVSKALAEAGEIERAKRMIEETLNITKRISEDSLRSEALVSISRALAKIGETERALDIARGISHEFRPSALSDISEALIKVGEIEKAKEIIKEASDIAGIISSDVIRVGALSDISVALAKAGDLEKAKRVIEEALGIAERIHDKSEYDVSHWFALLDVVEALAEIGETERALNIAKLISFYRSRIYALSIISEALVKDANIEKAKEIIKEAFSITKGIRIDWVRVGALSKIYTALRSIEQAQTY